MLQETVWILMSLGEKQQQKKLISLAACIRDTTCEVIPYQPLNSQRRGSAERCNQREKLPQQHCLLTLFDPIFIFLLLSHGTAEEKLGIVCFVWTSLKTEPGF